MGIISWIVVGLMAGFLVTALIGMAGASIGGFIARFLGGAGATGFSVWSLLVATLGAIILLFLYGFINRRTA